MAWKNVSLIFLREVKDQLRDRRTLLMITIMPVLVYPMLGMGAMNMMLTFNKQLRTVVVLNADELPDSPALLVDGSVNNQWLNDDADVKSIRVVTDLPDEQPVTDAESPEKNEPRRGLTDAQLVSNGEQLAKKFQSLLNSTDTDEMTDAQLSAIQSRLSQQFSESGIQVLVIIPEGYAASIARLKTETARADAGNESDLPVLHVLKNSADDKSSVAFARVRDLLQNWESALRAETFAAASLRPELQHPARLRWVEIAQGEEVAANIWSKMFPALMVIMTLTGAFYPAIDLGAGEKERGTMETLLISPAKRIELVFGKFLTVMMFSIGTALMNLLSMGLTGQHMASVLGGAETRLNLEFPGFESLIWLLILLIPLAALFSALCLALATFAKSTKEGQYYLTPLLMVVLGLTLFCLMPGVEITPLYSVVPVVNVALLLKGMLLSTSQSGDLLMYAVPVLVSSIGYSALAIWWAIDLYNSEGVLFREAEKFDVRQWFVSLTRDKEPVPAIPEAVFCFLIIMMLQFVAMNYLKPDINAADSDRQILRTLVIQQLTMIACPAIFMALILTTSLKATLRLRMPSLTSMIMGVSLAFFVHPLSIELSGFMVERGILPPPPPEISRVSEILSGSSLPAVMILGVLAVTPAVCEEIAFRGFILSGLARGGRLKVAVIVSSMMFGIVHMIPQQAFNAALVGLVIGLLAVHSRSLFPAIAFHLCSNTIASLHAGNGFGLQPDGVFFSEVEGQLRYETPTLLLCGIAVSVVIARMIRDLKAEQKEKHRTAMKSFERPAQNESFAAEI